MKPARPVTAAATRIDDAALVGLLSSADARRALCGRKVVSLRRAPGAYHSSFAIEDVEVALDDGSSLRLVLKDVSPAGLLADAARAKPRFLYDPRREIETYRHVLRPYDVGAPALVAAAADDARQSYVLVLEQVAGVPLWQVGDIDAWAGAARWLAATHQRLAPVAARLAGPARLLRYDADYYGRWLERANRSAAHLAGVYERSVARLLELPLTIIHGEFHASNIIAEPTGPCVRVRPVDWEMAALGPGLMDVADLTAGKWDAGQRDVMTGAYRAALGPSAAAGAGSFDRDLDCCRLHRALQWACWSDDWSPPREHEQDWLSEAERVALRLGVG